MRFLPWGRAATRRSCCGDKEMVEAFRRRANFYSDCVRGLVPDPTASVLVVAAREADAKVLAELGFTDVVISNIETSLRSDQFAPFRWSHQDAHALAYEDRAFDYVLVHDGLHHCSSPHRALLEMYRVARRGLLVVESRDSLVMRLLIRLRLTADYETFAVHSSDGTGGGVDNTEIPNFVFRWTEKQVRQTINAYAPHAAHRIEFRYGWSPPCTPPIEQRNRLKRLLTTVALPLYRVFVAACPKQQNHFAFFVAKPWLPEDLHPWLEMRGERIGFNREWGRRMYGS